MPAAGVMTEMVAESSASIMRLIALSGRPAARIVSAFESGPTLSKAAWTSVCEDDPQIFAGMFRCIFEYGLKEKEGFLEHGVGLAVELGAVKERGGSRGCCSAYGLGKPSCCELVHDF